LPSPEFGLGYLYTGFAGAWGKTAIGVLTSGMVMHAVS
jgi:hypothetical protein